MSLCTPTAAATDTATATATATPTATPTLTPTATLGAAQSVTIDYTYDPLYRLTSATYSGDITTTIGYSYDEVGNRLTQTIDGATTTYGYDNANRLTSVNGVTYSWDNNGNLLSDGVNTYQYDQANRLISVNGQTTYDPFGNVLSATGAGSVYGFTGERTDNTGLVFLRARYYSPTQGRFFAHDPWGGDAALPSTLHPYQYGLNNPVLYTDPSGRCIGLLSDLARNWDVTKQSCQNYDAATQIVQNDKVDLGTRILAGTIIVGTWVGYGGVQVGGVLLGGEAVGAAAGPLAGACAMGGGLGVVGQGFADEFTGPSEWTDYAGNAVGGCLTGGLSGAIPSTAPTAARITGNIVAATGGGAAADFAKQSLDNIFDGDCFDQFKYDTDQILTEGMTWGATAGLFEFGRWGFKSGARWIKDLWKPNTLAVLQPLATQADDAIGAYGAVAGTLKHAEFERLVNSLGRSNLLKFRLFSGTLKFLHTRTCSVQHHGTWPSREFAAEIR